MTAAVHVVLPPQRVDRAVAGGHRRQRRFAAAQPHLVAPVEALLVGAGLVDETHLAAGVADRGVGERGDQRAQRARLPDRVGVREGQQLAARGRHGGVLRAHLAARGSSSTTSAPAARARSAVASAPGSAPPSTATTISSRSRGQSSASAFSTLAAITSCSPYAATIRLTSGMPMSPDGETRGLPRSRRSAASATP